MKTPAPKSTAPRETVAALHQRRALEQRETMARIAAMPALGAPLASVFAAEPDNAPAVARQEVGFAPLPENPTTRAKAGWGKAFAAAEKERIG